MNPTVQLYLAYLAVVVPVVIWVARTLHRNGRLFLVDVFAGNREIADSVNHLLVVGFYLINLGYVALALKADRYPEDLQGVIEALSTKVGVVLLVLGAMHFFNLFVFSRMRRRALLENAAPPVEPDGRIQTVPAQP